MTPTRQRLSAETRRAQLMDATVTVVARDGFAAANADAIAVTAGVSKGLLWHYFTDFDALLAATAERCFEQLVGAVVAAVDPAAPVPDLLRTAIRTAAGLPATHGEILLAVRQIATNLRRADGTLHFDESAYAELYAGQEALFRRGQEAGQVRAGLDPRLLAVTYQSTVDGMIDHLVRNPSVSPDAFAGLVAEVLLSGLTRTDGGR